MKIEHLKNKIKTVFRPIYYLLWQLINIIRRKPKAQGYIFMLHRVAEWNMSGLYWNEHMKVSPQKLDNILKKMKHKYDFIRLEDVPQRLNSKGKFKKKFVVFTMDDGYKDNLTIALPIFKKYNVPYTIFLVSDFMDKKALLWWYVLEDLLLTNNEIKLSNGIVYPAKTMDEKCRSFLDIRAEILKLDQENLDQGLNDLFKEYHVDWYVHNDELCLDWNDINILKNEDLVTLGAHTKHHFNLKELDTRERVKQEVLDGCKRIHEQAGFVPKVFAYPFGSANEVGLREYNVLAELGETLSVATIGYGGPVLGSDSCNLYSLPRIMLKEDSSFVTLLKEAKKVRLI